MFYIHVEVLLYNFKLGTLIKGGNFMKKKLSLFLTALFVTGAVTGCGKNTQTTSSNGGAETIKIGLDYELSGQAATYGQSLVQGI